MAQENQLIKYMLVPVYDKDEIVLYDIYIDKEWVGSKSTLKQAKERVEFLCKKLKL
jgi:hypothetical protein